MSFPREKFTRWFEENEERILRDFFQFLGFSSISTNPASRGECIKTANWLLERLEKIGMKTELLQSPGLPVVFSTKGKEESPSVLLYHHYDVQPVDPIELWKSSPFEARMEDGKIFARGASDNKGQCFISLTVLEALKDITLPKDLQIKLFIEGEEESGGAGTEAVIEQNKERLKADSLCVIDFDLPDPGVPGISMGYRGIVAFHVECVNAATDLHSGIHGGIALNPNRILVGVLSKLWDEKGRVTIPHFYDGVEALPEEEIAKMNLSFDEKKYREEFGVGALSQEEGVGSREACWLRPTVEINGMWGGYTGEGFKTVIPGSSYAKISCRLVGDQDPVAIAKNLEAFLKKNTPKGATMKVSCHHGAKAFRSSFSSPLTKVVTKSLEEVFAKPCQYTLCGGSIPIVRQLAEAVGGEVALFGFALATDNVHAPNEHFRWECFKKGFISVAKILWELSCQEKHGKK